MKGIPGILLLFIIVNNVEADTSANDTATATQDSGLDGDLASSVGQSGPSTLACVPFCFPDYNGKREIHRTASVARKMQDVKVQRRFQPESRRSIGQKSDFTSLTIPQLIDRNRRALKRQQQMQAKQIRKDRESIAPYKRGVSKQSLLPARLQ